MGAENSTSTMELGGMITGSVSWFSNSKGFGFIKPVDGSDDLFVHISAVQGAGHQSLRDGATVVCEIEPGKKGRQVAKIVNIDDSTATGPSVANGASRNAANFMRSNDANDSFGTGFTEKDVEGSVPGEGQVKWFNMTKGFGFISPDQGGRDVFLHANVVRRAGLHEVMPGLRVKYNAIERDKGPEARTVEVVSSN